MAEDKEGFLYPAVDISVCIDCGLCEKVCPVINKKSKRELPTEIWALKINDNQARNNSSSGGAFTAIATQILEKGGVVFGVRFNSKWEAVHDYTDTIEGLTAFQSSKYVQSSVGDTYKRVESFLKEGIAVMFTGTPCQVAALKLYLRKDYDNLYTMDFVCHGVPSPGIFRWHLQERLNKITRTNCNGNIKSIPADLAIPSDVTLTDIKFRDKRKGWKVYSFSIYGNIKGGNAKGNTLYTRNLFSDPYLKGFIHDLYLRPSCHECPSKGLSSGSDITVADFWGQEYTFPAFDNNTGVSAVLANTYKGKEIIQSLKGCTFEARPRHEFLKYNPSILSAPKVPFRRDLFWEQVGSKTFSENIRLCFKQSLITTVKSILKRILKR